MKKIATFIIFFLFLYSFAYTQNVYIEEGYHGYDVATIEEVNSYSFGVLYQYDIVTEDNQRITYKSFNNSQQLPPNTKVIRVIAWMYNYGIVGLLQQTRWIRL